MTVYAWQPEWLPQRFELRIVPNTRVFVGPYTPTTQVVDLMGERWQAVVEMPPGRDPVRGAAFEAFFDRLKGPAHQVALWNLRFAIPNGTLRATDSTTVSVVNGALAAVSVVNSALAAVTVTSGQPNLRAPVEQGANTATLTALPGRTVRAGDMLGLAGQTVRMMADATADAQGALAIEFQPRARSAMAAGTAIVTERPTINFMLKAEGVPVRWEPGMHQGPSAEFIEVI